MYKTSKNAITRKNNAGSQNFNTLIELMYIYYIYKVLSHLSKLYWKIPHGNISSSKELIILFLHGIQVLIWSYILKNLI